jgi:hypothetical protein
VFYYFALDVFKVTRKIKIKKIKNVCGEIWLSCLSTQNDKKECI